MRRLIEKAVGRLAWLRPYPKIIRSGPLPEDGKIAVILDYSKEEGDKDDRKD
jgi:hypothetical protein